MCYFFMIQIGKYVKPCMKGCNSTPECSTNCKSMGHSNGGACLVYDYGTVCCCETMFKSQDDSPISNLPDY